MIYMKLLEDKIEDQEIIDAFEICFQELKDKGYIVEIRKIMQSQVNFSGGVIIRKYSQFNQILNQPNKHYFYTTIYKISNNHQSFNIKDIINDLLFTKSYLKDIFELNIGRLYIAFQKSANNWYDNIEDLPLDDNIYKLNIFFTKD